MQIIITPLAEKQLACISDRRIQQGIERAIESLEVNPDIKGKALIGPLSGCRSVRAVAQRYRVIYKINYEQETVFIVALGIRKEGDRADIYALATKLVKAGILALFILAAILFSTVDFP